MPMPRYAVVRWSSDSCAVRLVDRRRARPLPTAGDGRHDLQVIANSEAVRALIGRTMHSTQATPKYLICDQGGQFLCDGFKSWCKGRNIRPRYRAIGKHGSLAVIERFILAMKSEYVRHRLISLRRDAFCRELILFAD